LGKNNNKFTSNKNSEYEEENNLVGYSDYDLIIKPETNSLSNYCKNGECSVGNLVCDGIEVTGETDFAIIYGDIIKSNINRGNITKAKLLEVLPFKNNIKIMKLSGKTIFDILEFGVRNYPLPSDAFPQISSNLSFSFNPDIISTVSTDTNGAFINITGDKRIFNVKVKGKDLDQQKIYSVALLDCMAKGGNGYSMLNKYEVFKEISITDIDALSFYIKNNLEGKIPKKYSTYQGRININNSTKNEEYIVFIPNKKSEVGLSKKAKIVIIIHCFVIVIIIVLLLIICIKGKSSTSDNLPTTMSSQASNLK
jgi:2',3'-cyclic-nucleotide 2'-phosphodiesterase (5'-nucleotidase family)